MFQLKMIKYVMQVKHTWVIYGEMLFMRRPAITSNQSGGRNIVRNSQMASVNIIVNMFNI